MSTHPVMYLLHIALPSTNAGGKEWLLAHGKSMATVTHLTFIGFTTNLMKNERKRVEFSSFTPRPTKKATQPGSLTDAVFWLPVAPVPLPFGDDYV